MKIIVDEDQPFFHGKPLLRAFQDIPECPHSDTGKPFESQGRCLEILDAVVKEGNRTALPGVETGVQEARLCRERT